MATLDAGKNEEENAEQIPVVSGSDHVYDFFCELCRDDGKNVEAEGFCVDCDEYLCDMCFRGHRRTRPTRHHVVMDKDNMPKNAPLTPEKVSKDIATKCPSHQNRTVEYYCKSHDKLGCSLCFVRGHSKCGPDVECISDQLGAIESKEYEEFITEMKLLQKGARVVVSKTHLHVASAEQCSTDAVEAIQIFRHIVNARFDKFDDVIKRQAEQTKSNDIAKMTLLSTEGNRIADEIEHILSELAHLQSDRLACQLYIRLKKARREMTKLKKDLRKTEKQNVIEIYRFKPNVTLESLVNGPNGLGFLFHFSSIVPKHLCDLGVLFEQRVTEYSGYTYVRVEKNKACVTSIAPLSSKVVVVDTHNIRLAIIDISSKKLLTRLNIPEGPFDLTIIDNETVAVTVPDKKKIHFVRVTDKLEINRDIKVGSECYGIDYNRGKLVVSCANRSKPMIKILDLAGNVINSIENDEDGTPLFTNPAYVCVSEDGKTIYVSDNGSGKVYGISLDGVVKFEYKTKEPRKVCVDHYGNVYVCVYDQGEVHMLSPECTLMKVLLQQSDVCSVCHCSTTNRLFVGMINSSAVKMFQL